MSCPTCKCCTGACCCGTECTVTTCEDCQAKSPYHVFRGIKTTCAAPGSPECEKLAQESTTISSGGTTITITYPPPPECVECEAPKGVCCSGPRRKTCTTEIEECPCKNSATGDDPEPTWTAGAEQCPCGDECCDTEGIGGPVEFCCAETVCCEEGQVCCNSACCDNVCCEGECCAEGQCCIDGVCQECECASNADCPEGECCYEGNCQELWFADQRVSVPINCDLSGAGLTFLDFDGTLYQWFSYSGPYTTEAEAIAASGLSPCDPFELCAAVDALCGSGLCDPADGTYSANCTYTKQDPCPDDPP